MESVLYDRVKNLCADNSIYISSLEKELGMSKGAISKWKISYPSADKLCVVAKMFHTSVDYLLGMTDIRVPIDDIFNDSDIISLQRAREQMSAVDKSRMMAILKLSFAHAFNDGEEIDIDAIINK